MHKNWYKLSQSSSQYTVKDKDTLSSIAQNVLGSSSRWVEIAKLNPNINPNQIKAGMVLNMPSQNDSLSASVPASTSQGAPVRSQTNPSNNVKSYIIQQNDTLSGIAEKTLGSAARWREIAALNPGLDPKNLKIGTEVIIPDISKKEETTNETTTAISSPLDALKNEIAKGEGGYNSYNRGKAGDTPNPAIDITKLTVGEVMQRQKGSPGRPRDFFAVGKYQFVPQTLAAAVRFKRSGVSKTDLFSPETQEKLFPYLLYKQPAVINYLNGTSNSIEDAVNGLAAEFASLPNTSGVGNYDKKAGNKGKGGLGRVEKIKTILIQLRNSGMFK
jgi:LysM repeat protein